MSLLNFVTWDSCHLVTFHVAVLSRRKTAILSRGKTAILSSAMSLFCHVGKQPFVTCKGAILSIQEEWHRVLNSSGVPTSMWVLFYTVNGLNLYCCTPAPPPSTRLPQHHPHHPWTNHIPLLHPPIPWKFGLGLTCEKVTKLVFLSSSKHTQGSVIFL